MSQKKKNNQVQIKSKNANQAATPKNDRSGQKADNKKKSKKKAFDWKAWLISLSITVVILGLVVAAQYWFVNTTHIELEQKSVWVGNGIGGFIMLFIVHHFVKKPDPEDDPYRQ